VNEGARLMKEVFVLGGLLLAGAYFAGVFDAGGGIQRVVDRPVAQVARALDDLDISDQPGSPGTDATASGGVKPMIRHDRTSTGIVYTVMSGDKVATRMFADLTPVDDGKRTKVTARVERGDAPDDLVSPAFRSTGITVGLFSMALEDELNDLTRPVAASAERCQEMVEEWRLRGARETMDNGVPARPENLQAAFGETARNIVKLNAMEQKLRAAGCDTSDRGEFRPVEQRMKMN
jgi:hypothetical protein